jgi:hypothetical protein
MLCFLGLAGCDPSPFEDANHREAGGESGGRGGRGAASGKGGAQADDATAGTGSSEIIDAGRDDAGTRDTGPADPPDAGGQAGTAGAAPAAGSGGAGAPADTCQRADPDAAVQLVRTEEVGSVATPSALVLRIPGPISWIGGNKLVWLFPKANRVMNAVGAGSAPNQPHAAFVVRESPTQLEEDLVPDGVPRRFVTADDENAATELWPTALIRVPPPSDRENATGIAFVRRIAPDFSFDVHIGRVAKNTTTVQEPLIPLFTGDEPKFSTGGFRGSEYAYLFGCTEDTSVADRGDARHFPCKIARVRVGQLEQRDGYRVYDPAQDKWLEDLSAGAPVLFGPSSLLSLSFNNYLGRYIAVYSRWFSSEVILQSARSPWGPWRQEFSIALPAPVDGVLQAGLEQAALVAPETCASTIWISYMSPTASMNGFPTEAENKLIKAELQ